MKLRFSYIHSLISVPSQLSVSKLVQYLKDTSSIKLQQEFRHLQIAKYINNQSIPKRIFQCCCPLFH